jgi:hypothetical protein
VLLGPFRWQVSEANNAHAVWEYAIDRGFDEIGREESQRDRHIHLAGGAVLALCNRFRSCGRVDDEFFKPAPPAGDGCD